MLMQNFGVTNKEHYGMLWYFCSGQLYWRDFYTNKLANPSVACSSDDFFGPANVFAPGSAMKLEKEEEMGNSPVNLGIFEAQHQTNCNRIVFKAI